jgi:pilus assembly protein CpaE
MFSIKGFSNTDFETAKRFFRLREALRNQVLYEEGKPAQSMFFIDTGSVKLVERKSLDGKDDTLFSIVKPGGFFGEEAVLSDNSLYQHTAIALETCGIYEFSRDDLQNLLIEAVGTGTKLLLGVSKNYREAASSPENSGKLISFYSPKGGVGTTELAVNTAVKLAAAGKNVAFIDADFQFGDAGVYLGAGSAPNIARMIQIEEILVYDRIKLYLQKVAGVAFLAPPNLPQESEIVSRSHLNQIVLELGKKFDFIVADCSSSILEDTLFLWDNAEMIALVGKPEFASLTSFQRLMRVLGRLDYPAGKLSLLLSCCHEANTGSEEEFKKVFPGKVFSIPQNQELSRKAHVEGKPFVLTSPHDPMSVAVDHYAKTLLGNEEKCVAKGGIFSRLKSLFG